MTTAYKVNAISRAQKESWARNPDERALAVALGHVRNVIAKHPEWAPKFVEVIYESLADDER